LFNVLITVPGVKRPNQTGPGDAMGPNSMTPGGTKGMPSQSFVSPKNSSGLFGSRVMGESGGGGGGGGGLPRVLSPSATMSHLPRRETLINLPPLRSKSSTDLGGSGGAGSSVKGDTGGSVASAPAELSAPVTTVTRNKAGKKKRTSGKPGAKRTPPKAK
jgi:hypothetical protein